MRLDPVGEVRKRCCFRYFNRRFGIGCGLDRVRTGEMTLDLRAWRGDQARSHRSLFGAEKESCRRRTSVLKGLAMSRWFAGIQRSEAGRTALVSATVYLLPDKLELIKQICGDKNLRISDFLSEAVDSYLLQAPRRVAL